MDWHKATSLTLWDCRNINRVEYVFIPAWRKFLFEQIERTVEMLQHIVLDRAPTVNWDAVFIYLFIFFLNGKDIAAIENDVYCP